VRRQQTLERCVAATGVGLHGGRPATLTLVPAGPDSGVVFDCPGPDGRVEVPARAASALPGSLATTLACDGASVRTVEHLLAALSGLAIDNLRVRVEGDELPALDGSAAELACLVRAGGRVAQAAPVEPLRLDRPVEVRRGEASIRAEPGEGLSIHYAIDFPHPAIGRQALDYTASGARHFEAEIAPARTFGFLRDAEALWDAGLARGASLANTVVIDDDGVRNPGGWRRPDEAVRHKVLDLCGDLALLGRPLEAHIRVERGGHALHRALVDALLDERGR